MIENKDIPHPVIVVFLPGSISDVSLVCFHALGRTRVAKELHVNFHRVPYGLP